MNVPLWFSNLAFWSIQTALLVLAAGFLPRLLQIRRPRILVVYWRALLAVSLLLPLIQPWRRAPNIGTITMESGINGAVPASSTAVAPWHFPGVQIIAQIIGAAILAGIVARLMILALGLLRLRQVRRASSLISVLSGSSAVLEEMRTRVNARAEFRLSADVDSPVTFGFAAPVILLPECFTSMDARFQSAIACHELLHVRRRDWAHHLAEEILRAALWFHPAIVWLISRVRLAREQLVDLDVVKLTNARKTYLEALLEFVHVGPRSAAISAPPFLVESQIAERIALILKEVQMSRTRLIASLTGITCWLTLAGMLAVWSFPLKAAPRTPQNTAQSGVTQRVSTTPPALENGVEILIPNGEADFQTFETHLLESVRQNWLSAMPSDAKRGLRGKVVLRLTIQKDGTLRGQAPVIEVSSGVKSLDNAAMAAVLSAAPFDHLPDSFHGSRVELRIPFFYNVLPPSAQHH